VNYDEFKSTFFDALKESRLPVIGIGPGEETLDLRSTRRTMKVYVEPIAAEIARPFHVSGTISWSWDCLLTARTASTEEDLLAELLGREGSMGIATECPSLRVDIKLHASLEYGKAIPMPPPTVWTKWSREAIGRLETVERLVTDETIGETADGRDAILAWQGNPEIKISCTPDGQLRLESISVRAFQIIELPRRWDDPDREPDDDPYDQLAQMLQRVKAALYAWSEVMDHFR
jgi:hypothetical protein